MLVLLFFLPRILRQTPLGGAEVRRLILPTRTPPPVRQVQELLHDRHVLPPLRRERLAQRVLRRPALPRLHAAAREVVRDHVLRLRRLAEIAVHHVVHVTPGHLRAAADAVAAHVVVWQKALHGAPAVHPPEPLAAPARPRTEVSLAQHLVDLVVVRLRPLVGPHHEVAAVHLLDVPRALRVAERRVRRHPRRLEDPVEGLAEVDVGVHQRDHLDVEGGGTPRLQLQHLPDADGAVLHDLFGDLRVADVGGLDGQLDDLRLPAEAVEEGDVVLRHVGEVRDELHVVRHMVAEAVHLRRLHRNVVKHPFRAALELTIVVALVHEDGQRNLLLFALL
eukprot:Rhum_TRINITY_DN13925_c8_g1::Rhum_TRINITY_DN13925_c8_g1_i1::g.65604::m.65604